MNRLFLISLLFTSAVGCGLDGYSTYDYSYEVVTSPSLFECEYSQAFGNAAHTGCPTLPRHGLRVVASFIQDFDAPARVASQGFLQINEPATVVAGDFVVLPKVSGYHGDPADPTQTWTPQILRWKCAPHKIAPCVNHKDSTLVPTAEVSTDWKPTDAVLGSFGTFSNGYVGGYYPAIAQRSNSLYLARASGKLDRVDLNTGAVIATIDPFVGSPFANDRRTIAVGGLAIDQDSGTVYYTVTAFNAASNEFNAPVRESWLVRVKPDNTATAVPWSTIAAVPGVPASNALCSYPFGTDGGPAPSSSASVPPQLPCGKQAPVFNSPPAISPTTGKIAVFSSTHNGEGVAFLIEIDPVTLSPVRAYDTRDHLLTGCGVRETDNDDPLCSTITDGFTKHIGFDATWNEPVKIIGTDLTNSAPAYSPDGSMLCVGGYDGGFAFGGGFDARGGQVCFSTATGAIAATNQEFGWEVTPSAWAHDGGFSWLQDRQMYSDLVLGVARYSSTFDLQVESDIDPLTDPDDVDAVAVDFLDSNILFDTDGTHYATNGNGHLYSFDAAGNRLEDVVLPDDTGAPCSMEGLSSVNARDRFGRIYTSQCGRLYVVMGDIPGPATRVPSALTLNRQTAATAVARPRAARVVRNGPMFPVPPLRK